MTSSYTRRDARETGLVESSAEMYFAVQTDRPGKLTRAAAWDLVRPEGAPARLDADPDFGYYVMSWGSLYIVGAGVS